MNVDSSKLYKTITENQKELLAIRKENKELKKIIKVLENKVCLVLDKIQEFEIVLDAAELIEDQIDEQTKEDNRYNTEWNPYEDEDFRGEDYENYDDDEESPYDNGY